MLSVASLLNPVKSDSRGTPLPSSPALSLCVSSSAQGSPQLSSSQSSSVTKKQKMTKDGAIFIKGKIKGQVNYPPFERLDEDTLREVQKFQVYPLGNIQEYCRHIPYNSEKKSFLEKTGRESFEVFQYVFKVPGDDKEYTVMWDYNIGLVRITPFFKCCKYSKTTPAKMLGMNAGLKEITHSITGGALAAQGYWMPYSCALAVCTTFCSHISPALIPIFGPSFPSLCVSIEAPEHGRMIIPQQTIQQSTLEATAHRSRYSSFSPQPSSHPHNCNSYSPHRQTSFIRSGPDSETGMKGSSIRSTATPPQLQNHRLRLKRPFANHDSPYETATDDAASETSSGDGYYHEPITPVSASSSSHYPPNWRTQDHSIHSHSAKSSLNIGDQMFKGPNPLLSAIPRSSNILSPYVHSHGLAGLHIGPHLQTGGSAPWRAANHRRPLPSSAASSPHDSPRQAGVGTDDEMAYDGSSSTNGADDQDKLSDGAIHSPIGSPVRSDKDADMADVDAVGSPCSIGSTSGVLGERGDSGLEGGEGSTIDSSGSAEKKAAKLLMKLSFKDGEMNGAAAAVDAGGREEKEVDGPRVKRRRGASL